MVTPRNHRIARKKARAIQPLENMISTAGKITVGNKIAAACIREPHVVDIDETQRLRIGKTENHWAPQRPRTRSDLARG